ncbi:MAG: hypothetical protein WCS72_19880 [Deltaproteobacteria bacterium]
MLGLPELPLGPLAGRLADQAIEKIVTETESKDEAAMEELKGRGITPFVVPDDDKDHQGSVYDSEEPDLF